MKLLPSICFLFFVLLSQNSLAKQKIVVTVTMETKSEKENEIVYRKGQNLTLDDFQGTEEPNMDAVAMAYSGVSLRYTGSVKKGEVILHIKMFASFDKSRSWCLPSSRNERTLAHEQRHFDITALNACALFIELNAFTFTENFEKEIQQFQEKYKQKNFIDQDNYDAETNHGIKREVQQEWNEKIIKSIGECSDCYNK